MKPLSLSAWVAAVLASSPAVAAYVPCEGCTPPQMASAARTAGAGEHVVLSVSTGVIRKFQVERDVLDRLGGVRDRWIALPVSPNEQDVSQFAALMEIHKISGGSMILSSELNLSELTELPEEMRSSRITDYVMDAGLRARIADAIGRYDSTAPTLVTWQPYVQKAGSMLGATATRLQYTLKFSDGGDVRFTVEPLEDYAEQLGEPRDKNDNPVVDSNSQDNAGTYYFDHGWEASMAFRHWLALGIQPSGPQPYNGSQPVRCVLVWDWEANVPSLRMSCTGR